MNDLDRYRQTVAEKLKSFRYRHSVRVAETAVELADLWGEDKEKAYLAGLLHDYARDEPYSRLFEIAALKDLPVTNVDRFFPVLLHAPVGAILVQDEFSIADEDVISAIAVHTTGAPHMGLLDKLIYLADMVEPNRNFPGVDYIRRSCFVDLNQALLAAFDSVLGFCVEQERPVHPKTVEARNTFLLGRLDGR